MDYSNLFFDYELLTYDNSLVIAFFISLNVTFCHCSAGKTRRLRSAKSLQTKSKSSAVHDRT